MKRKHWPMLMIAVPIIGLVVGYLLMTRNVPATIDARR